MLASIRSHWNMFSPLAKGAGIVGIVVAMFAIWAFSPMLYNRQVVEPFPATANAPAMPAMAETVPTAMPAMAETVPTAMPAMAETVPTAMAPSAPVLLSSGNFIAGSTAGDSAKGSATIYQLADGKRVLRLEGFSTTNGPDLVVALHPGANPEKDAGQYLVLTGLKGNQGDQNYELPADFDQRNYRSVVIWCRTFNVVFGYAALKDV